MNERWLDGLRDLIWKLHVGGAPISEIQERTRCDESFVRSAITDVWAADAKGRVMRDAA